MPEQHRSAIASLIMESRRNLLDLSLRNRLLNHRVTKTRDIEIVGEDPVEILRILVAEQKAMVFDGVDPREAGDEESGDDDYVPPAVDTTDNRLQTRIPTTKLHFRLLKIQSDARTALEEQGANLLFLALGMVEWFETSEATEPRRAPLLLIPVLLERGGSDRFTLKYSGEDIGTNLSFQAKLKSEYGLDVPALPEADEIDIAEYFDAVEAEIAGLARWRVARDKVVLGFFTFSRFLMYRDLDPAAWPATDGPGDHGVMKALVERFADLDGALSEDMYLDDLRPVAEVHEVVDADSSQILALEDAKARRTLVIEGPPGTGKSQTITNLIAEAVAAGRTVLFVAEKMAALEVVKRNLDRVELGDACLELHSNKANKRELLRRLEHTLNLAPPRDGDAESTLRQLGTTRDRLTAYARSLHEPIGESGVTPFSAIGRLLQLDASSCVEPRSDFAEVGAFDQRALELPQDLAERLQARLNSCGALRLNPYRGCRPASLLPVDRPILERELQDTAAASEVLSERIGHLADALRQPLPERVAEVESMASLAIGLSTSPEFADRAALNTPDWLTSEPALNAALAMGEEFASLHCAQDATVRESAWTADVAASSATLRRFERRFWRILSGDFRKARAHARSLMRQPDASPLKSLISSLEAITRARALSEDLAATAPACARLLGALWRGLETDWAVAKATSAWAVSIHRDVNSGRVPRDILQVKFSPDYCAALRQFADRATEALSSYRTGWETLESRLVPGPELFPDGLEASTIAMRRQVLAAWAESPGRLWDFVGYSAIREEFRAAGLPSLCRIADDWDEAQPTLPWILEVTWLEGLLRQALTARPALAAFDHSEHGQLVLRFAELDREVLRCNRARVAAAHHRSLPPRGGAGAMGILTDQFARQRRHLSIRRLMSSCWRPVQAIKPVFMMSPLSVAMFLPPDGPRFDLVIFDEASQVRPEDAFGAILRGAQTIVVGDSKQMPPTSFFTRMTSGDEDEEESEEAGVRDMESILGLFRARNAPYRQLRWHYRSRHHSLISVSNHEFYDDRLIVFPSPIDGEGNDSVGLSFRHLPLTVYGRGESRTNPEEARAVAEAVAEHARTSPHFSLGVAAFSQAQQDAIQTQLERMRADHPELREFELLHPHEPFFVKNLENVQGDERDAIFISIGYGRDSEGYLSHSFGPLNPDGGERRLNVLISRAKHKCVVFSNFTHEDIDLHRTQSRGVRALKTFLKYAQTRVLDTPRPSGGDPESPFEEVVRDALVERGYRIDCQVGSAGFFIDLAVVDPYHPGRYLLGIECDGAKYHSARSARDRDRLREQVLIAKGWRIHRIWGSNWYRDPALCLARAEEAIAFALRAEERRATPGGDAIAPPTDSGASQPLAVVRLSEPLAPAANAGVTPYEVTPLSIPGLSVPLHEVPEAQLCEWAMTVVRMEGPVHFEEIVRRIREAAGVGRAGNRISGAIERALELLCGYGKLERQGQFFWSIDLARPRVRSRDGFLPQHKRLEFISPQEIDEALLVTTGRALGITEDDLVAETLRTLGFGRVTADLQAPVRARVAAVLQRGDLQMRGGQLFLSAPGDSGSTP